MAPGDTNVGSRPCWITRVCWRSWAALERRTSRSGKDSIDHGPGGHDDLTNAAAGALGLVLARSVAAIRPEDFVLGAPSRIEALLPPGPDWRTAFPEYDHADW